MKTNKKIVCISGLANSGKSTAADMLYYILNAPKTFRCYWFYKVLKKWPFKKNWYLTAFAKPLKQTLAIILNVTEDWLNNRDNKEKMYVDLKTMQLYPQYKLLPEVKISENKFSKLLKQNEPIPNDYCLSVRQLLQYYGTECIRRFLGDKTWINATLNKQDSNLIISDLRFRVECEEIKRRKGIIVYINRDLAKPGTHTSEREVLELKDENKFDYIIDNNGSMRELFNNLNKIKWQ